MTFVTAGLAIAGLVSIVLPILIHILARQRKRPIEWAAMRFLLEAYRKHKRRLQLEQLLLLLTRCLILILLGGALARPILEAAGILDDKNGRIVLLVLDNGLASSVNTDGNTTALKRHIEEAKEIINSLDQSDAVGIVTAALPVKSPVMPASLDHSAVIDLLDSLESTESPTDLHTALRTVRDASTTEEADGRNVVVYLLSDFREGSAALESPLPNLFDEVAEDVTLLASPPASEPGINVQVVAIDPVRRLILPGANDGSQQITVRIERHGGELRRAVSRVRLSGEGLPPVETETIEWSAGQSVASVTFSVDFAQVIGKEIGLKATLENIDSLDADNSRYLSLDVRDKLRVAMVSPPTFQRIGLIDKMMPGQWIRRALRTSDTSNLEIVDVAPSSLDEVDLRTVDTTIVTRPDRLRETGWRALRSFVDRGGLLLITPPAELNVHPWTDQLAEYLDLPWRIELEVKNYEEGLVLADEQPPTELLKLLRAEVNELTRSLLTWRVLPIDTNETQAISVLEFEDGSPMMIMGAPRQKQSELSDDTDAPDLSRGMVLYLAVAPELSKWTNLPVQTFMVPLFQESVRQGLNLIRAAQQVTTGDRAAIAGLPRSADTLRGPDEKLIDLDTYRRPVESLMHSGMYEIIDSGGRDVGRLAVNLNTKAGRTALQSETAVNRWLSDSGNWRNYDPDNPAAALVTADGGSSIADSLLLLLFTLIVAETIMARRFSHAYRAGSDTGLSGGLKPTVIERHGAITT